MENNFVEFLQYINYFMTHIVQPFFNEKSSVFTLKNTNC